MRPAHVKEATGYKSTDIGMIPEDWDVYSLQDIVNQFMNGGTPSTKNEDFWSGNIPWITGADILEQEVAVIRRHITAAAVDSSATNVIPTGNLLIVSRTGVGKLAIAPCDIAISQDFTGILLRKEKILAGYLFRYLDFFQNVLVRQNQGTSIKGITRDTLAAILIAVPSSAEQRAIAEALSDMDGLIKSSQALIAKKKAIKQATMQQLLTGKTRLSGFSGEWKVGKLADFGIFRSGNGFPLAFQGHQSGDYPFFKVSDINNKGNKLLLKNANHWIREEVRKRLGANKFLTGSVVFAKIGAAIFLERKRLLSQESCLDNNMMAFSLTAPEACEQFFYYLFLRLELGKLVSTTALPSLSGREIGAIRVPLPPIKEQRAIASVLSDIDADIASLERRLDKTRSVKQGMMQQLLTGKVRLVKPTGRMENSAC